MMFSELIKVGAECTAPCTDTLGYLTVDDDGSFTGHSCALGAATVGYLVKSKMISRIRKHKLPDPFESGYNIQSISDFDGNTFRKLQDLMDKGKASLICRLLTSRGYSPQSGNIVASSSLFDVVAYMNDVLGLSREDIADIIVEAGVDFPVPVPNFGAKIFEGEPAFL